eukprot:Tbor_TRINITY_DN5377_c3_g6::TRINITY_DN5377_c3_g6_i1::g.4458::m.4458/K14848/RRB1, GRWD1; ribosome assembly protein RRB1
MVPKKGKRSSRNEEREDPDTCKAVRVYSPATQRRLAEVKKKEAAEEEVLLKAAIANGKERGKDKDKKKVTSRESVKESNNNNNNGRSQHEEGSDEEEWEDCSDDEEYEFDEDEEDIIVESDDESQDEEGEDYNKDKDAEGFIQEELKKEFGDKVKSISFADDVDGGEEDHGTAPTANKMIWRSDRPNKTGNNNNNNGTTPSGDDDGEAATAKKPSDASEVLEYSNKAYDSFFQLRTEYPCLSFDIIHDNDGSSRTKYPLSMYLVCGTQADEKSNNQLLILKITNICKTRNDEESDDDEDDALIGDGGSDDSDSDQEEDAVNGGEPLVDHRVIRHHGTANRVRCSRIPNPLAPAKKHTAVWSDMGHVQIFNIENDFAALSDFSNWSKEQARAWDKKKPQCLLFCSPSSSHTVEGYGLDWSSVRADSLASGDCGGNLFVWAPQEGGTWTSTSSAVVSSSTARRHRGSIEEIKWSPTEESVLFCGRAGGVVEIWDTRDMRKCQLHWQADPTDINVADWNRVKQASHLLVTGADSGAVSIWDLRKVMGVQSPAPLQQLPWHTGPITSVEFSRHNESVLSVTGDDGQCTLWDLSLERDPDEEREVIGELFGREDLTDLPDQLMFQHQGLVHPKEGHFHSQIPGMMVTTDYNGLHIFKPMNWKSLMK